MKNNDSNKKKFIRSLEQIPFNSTIYLYGSGEGGRNSRKLLERCRSDIVIAGYIDSIKSGRLDGLDVYSIEDLDDQFLTDSLILIAASAWQEIVNTLEKKGLINYKIFSDGYRFRLPFTSSLHNEIEDIENNEIKRSIILAVKYLYSADVPGDIADFGTSTGFSSTMLASAVAVFESTNVEFCSLRNIHLFDSFEGLPLTTSITDINSTAYKKGRIKGGACKGIGKKDLMEKVAETSQIDEKRLLVYDGWFKDTLPKVPDNTRFALIHLDCDLYQSTIEVLDACFRRKFVQEGTMFIFQDWNFHRGDPEFGDIKAWSEVVNEYNVTFSDAGHFAALGKKIIVRSYSGINSLFNRSG